MAQNSLQKNKSFDWVTMSVFFSLLLIGWLMVFSTLYDPSTPYDFVDITTPMGAQSMWVLLSIFTFIAALTIDWKFWNTLAFPIYGLTMLFLILVLFVGKEINGAKSWFSFGIFSFQPAEWAKFGTILALSSYLSFNKASQAYFSNMTVSIALFIAPALLILLQPDFGSALVYMSFFLMLYRRGMSPLIFIFGFGAALIFITSLVYGFYLVNVFLLFISLCVFIFDIEDAKKSLLILGAILLTMVFLLLQKETIYVILPPLVGMIYYGFIQVKKQNYKLLGFFIPLFIVASGFSFTSNYVFEHVLKPHQKDRINVWLQPSKCDPRGSLYNIIQSKMAIGSGGFQGKGFLQGEMTKLDYVPAQSTDFIFTSVGEEQGFIGVIGVILLFSILLVRCIIIAERANLEFIRNYSYGVVGILFLHFAFNIGMTMGLMPVVGIPLPFLSKGGSSLVAFTLMVAVLVKMDMARFRSN